MTLSLTPDVIRSLAVNRTVTVEFPFLTAYAPGPPGCCGGGGNSGLPTDRAVSAIANLPAKRKTRFKQLVGADIVVARVVTAGRQKSVEF